MIQETTNARIKRFSAVDRLFHVFLMVTFLIQSATGFSRLFFTTSWGKQLGNVFGGYETSLIVHKWVGVFMMIGFVIHTIYLLTRVQWRNLPQSIFGPDSLVPNFNDARHLWQRLRWFFGLGSPPKFERWTYWEKVRLLGGLLGLTLAGCYRSDDHVPTGNQPPVARLVAEYCPSSPPGGSRFGDLLYFYHSFFYRTRSADQFSHERGHVCGQHTAGRSTGGKTGLGCASSAGGQTGACQFKTAGSVVQSRLFCIRLRRPGMRRLSTDQWNRLQRGRQTALESVLFF